ncbi:MAG: RNA pseudouridine synthase [Paludibacteraceae bacterium]|nr:RNA pseudouridine synthase [Paludibacteraceae bacterium]
MFHRLQFSDEYSEPDAFTCPFCYQPHPWVLQASKQVQQYLSSQTAWHDELSRGKMFGVLIVRNAEGETGFLAAFSGLLQQSFHHDWFVPPVFDYLQPDGYFVQRTKVLTALKQQIEELQHSKTYAEAKLAVQSAINQSRQDIADYKSLMERHKAERDALRASGPDQDTLYKITRQSQFEKAELKRIKQKDEAAIDWARQAEIAIENRIAALQKERKQCSEALQTWLFEQYTVLNSKQQRRSLQRIFAECRNAAAPAGAGDCAAPKLLQYAYLHHYTPLAMGEFWWGQSPLGELREHGHFYPACQSKCAPILDFMLQGLNVEPNPLETAVDKELAILYEDSWLMAVNKPSGMLSVPGKIQPVSAETLLQQRYGSQLKAVHRLDLDTSGLLVLAKDADTYKTLQRMFAQRQVHKTYTAWVEGKPQQSEGEILLPLRPNPDDRPRQMVDFVHGKEAWTHYRVLRETGDGRCLLELQPHTGRTHQLRLHCAHPQGLDSPIVGDRLYGHHAKRLMLHCTSLSFTHPHTGEQTVIQCPPPF